MSKHEQLVELFKTYEQENEKFEQKGIKASGARARKALLDIAKLCKERRGEILEATKK